MRSILQDARALQQEITHNRRTIHQYAETGFDLPQTTAYVKEQLRLYGIEPQDVGRAGISCVIGQGEKTFLLRADMDALPMQEATGLEFAATNGNAHACGHDTHTSMLLGAAKLLKAREGELKGKVKLMFQPAEEKLAGAMDMIENGLLENPKVDAGMAMHMMTGVEDAKTGFVYHKPGGLTLSGDSIIIKITGKDAHGSTPYAGISAIDIAAHITLALHGLAQAEVPIYIPAVVVVGKIEGGTAPNTVAGQAVMNVSARCKEKEYREVLLRRIKEVSEALASSFGGSAEVIHEYGMPPLHNDPTVDAAVARYSAELLGDDHVQQLISFNGTEDFSMVAERVPATLVVLGMGSIEEGYEESLHNPAVCPNEEALPVGSAVYAYSAMRWLEDNA